MLTQNSFILSDEKSTLHALEDYFRQTALTQQIPLPRWATWS